jgi:tetratricopeptide (TPR) repeat protein
MIRPLTDLPLRLTVDWRDDHLLAVAYGHVVDGKREDEYVRLSDTASLLLSEPGGEPIGFVVDCINDLDPDDEFPELLEGPEFSVPELGLSAANPGEITTAALTAYHLNSTLDAALFHKAVDCEDEDGEERLANWRVCLGAGDLKAHFAIGYTLCELDRHREGYAHLRYYTELVPRNAWAWCWLGHACRGMGDEQEAVAAYEKALELEAEGSYETDASTCLEELAA